MQRTFLAIFLTICAATPLLASTREMEELNRVTAEEARLTQAIESLTSQLEAAGDDAARAKLSKECGRVSTERDSIRVKVYAAVLAAYRAEPKPDASLEQRAWDAFCASSDQDRVELAADLAQSMVEKKHPEPSLLERAAIAAFRAERFAQAAQLFEAARKRGPLSERTEKRIAFAFPAIVGDWAKEQEQRKQDEARGDLPRVRLETDAGNIDLELFEYQAPNTVANFVHLVESGFYNGTPFHRVLGNFMMQGGDPTGTGEGGPGWSVACECYREDYRHHFRGTLSMAHAGRDTGGSQFFITFAPTPHLDGMHTAFGRVIDGWDTLLRVTRRDPADESQLSIVPTKIIKATVLRKRDVPYVPEKLPEHVE